MNAALSGYAGERVFVTGDTGFKGAWLGYWLTRLGATVSGYALPPEHERGLYQSLGLAELVDHTDGDVRDLDRLVAAMQEASPRVVFHLAAQALVKPSYDDPVGTFATNVMGSVHLLEAVRRTESVESVVFITSDKAYKNKEWAWGYRESDELGGHDPYSASKAAAEVVFASYRDAFFGDGRVGMASVRAGNVVGGGDEAHARIVPDCIRALRAGEPLVLRRPEARRPWQHVLEPLGGYLLLGRRLLEDAARFGGAWNFGPRPESVRTVREVADRMLAGWGGGASRVVVEPADFHETQILRLSADKAHQELGWSPRWGFEATLDCTAAWYRAEAEGVADLRAFTAEQIDAYMATSEEGAG